jgi:hypothetical protein
MLKLIKETPWEEGIQVFLNLFEEERACVSFIIENLRKVVLLFLKIINRISLCVVK